MRWLGLAEWPEPSVRSPTSDAGPRDHWALGMRGGSESDAAFLGSGRQPVQEGDGRLHPPGHVPALADCRDPPADTRGQAVKLPSERTLYRLLDKLTRNTHTFSSATTRRSRAHGASGEFGELPLFAPGEVMQIDSTPLDVLVLLDNGVVGKVELTAMMTLRPGR